MTARNPISAERADDLAGKTVLVTGAAGGIGAAVAAYLAGAGANLVLSDIDRDGLSSVAEGLNGAPALPCDITQPARSTGWWRKHWPVPGRSMRWSIVRGSIRRAAAPGSSAQITGCASSMRISMAPGGAYVPCCRTCSHAGRDG